LASGRENASVGNIQINNLDLSPNKILISLQENISLREVEYDVSIAAATADFQAPGTSKALNSGNRFK
jgi:hypothetical protein